MKPIKLSMTAFGPYREKEVIDFRDLKNNRIFVISGATGAGKTTIFDGICYALYGSVSGEERDNAGNIRSDFADDQLHTAIELVFEMKGRQYRILRQLAHVKTGNKTATGEKNEFVEITLTEDGVVEVPVLDSHRVRDMNAKLEDIIGLTQDQFKQIVMLPQGEFRKLLTSDSQNKGDILRKIFKTENFKKMTDQLKTKKTQAESALSILKNEKVIHIERIREAFPQRDSELFEVLARENKSTTQILQGFESELKHYNELIEHSTMQLRETNAQIETSRKQLTAAEQFNKELQLYKAAEVRKQELMQQEDVVNNEKIRLLNAEKAEHIITYESNYRTQVKHLKELKEQLEFDRAAEQKAKELVENRTKELKQLEEQQQQHSERQKQLIEWQRILPLYEEVTQLEISLNETEIAFNKIATSKQQLERNIQYQIEQVKSNEQLKMQLQKEISDYDELLEHIAVLEKIQQHIIAKNNNLQVVHETKASITELHSKMQVSKNQFNQLEANWLSNQAYVLATQLVAGNPCPVCGSKTHEQLHFNKLDIVTREQVDAAKQIVNQMEQQSYQLTAKCNQAQNEANHHVSALASYASYNYDEGTNAETILQFKRQIERKLQQKQQLNELEHTQVNVRTFIESEREKLNQVQHQFNELQLKAKGQQVVIAEKRQQLPNEFTKQSELQHAIVNISNELMRFENAFKAMTDSYENAIKDLTAKQTSVVNRQEQVNGQFLREQEAEAEFKEKVFAAGFKDGKDYTAARLIPGKMAEVKKFIDEYMKECYALEKELAVGKVKYAGKVAVDLTNLSGLLNEQIQIANQINALISKNEHMITAGIRIKQQLEAAQRKMDELEIRAGHIIKLYDLLSGKNDLKISFERYLQIEYLEQIIQAANERLIPLSNGQYRLLRSDRLDGNGKQSGLSLDIYDTYTGQERDVKTLSGGEQFNASLSLALGMSDIIQSFKGNVHMDTMFIDEGFGTLDEEALAKAIDTLVDLQKTGRMIGIISHVAELKDTIPATLEVRKTKEGFSHTKFIIK